MLHLLASLALAAPPDVDTPLKGASKARKDAAVVVSVEDYTFLADATSASRDADALAAWLGTTRGLDRISRASDPDKAALQKAIDEGARNVRGGGTLWLYFAGHGTLDPDGRRMLLSREAAGDDLQGVLIDEMVSDLADSRAKQIVVILDANFGGLGRGGEPLGLPPVKLAPWEAPSKKHVSVWSATSAGEVAGTYPAAGHGMFTWLALGGLRGWADGSTGGAANGEVSLEELQFFVHKLSRQIGGKSYNPAGEKRSDVLKWVVARGGLEGGPSKDELAELAQAEKGRRLKEASDRLLAQADADWMELALTTAVASPTGIESLNRFIATYELATVAVDGVEVAVTVPQVSDARARLDGFTRDSRKVKGKKRPKKGSKSKVVTAPPAVSNTAACDDLVKLEPAAMGGTLTPEQLTCLEAKIAKAQKQTDKDKVSRVMLANADSKGAIPEWMRLASRHLDEIDRSDPDLCFRYALTLSRNGTIDDAEEVLHWIDYALENKSQWEGPNYVARVYNLHRLRAETAARVWVDAEAELLTDRSDENISAAEEARGLAKNLAREWLDYANSAAQPADRAFKLCEAAAGSPTFCTANTAKPTQLQ